jgi:ArsR family transcriptional regulator
MNKPIGMTAAAATKVENVQEAALVLRALSNPSRLMILCFLTEAERTVGEIEEALDMGQAYVSQQLARLRDEGIVSATRDGRRMRYRLSDPRIAPVIAVLCEEFGTSH